MKKIPECCAGFILCLSLFFALSFSAYAETAPDTSKTGSISVELTYNGRAVSGGEIAVYKAGDISMENGTYGFILSGAFSGSGLSFDIDYDEAVQVEALAASLCAYAYENNISGTAVSVNSDGEAYLDGLACGLYLVVQIQAADEYEAFAPFLVSIPMYDETDGEYIYDVDASPKVSLKESEEETDPDDGEEETSASDEGERDPSGEEETTPSGSEEETAPEDNENEDETTSDGDDEIPKDDEEDGGTPDDSGADAGDSFHLRFWFFAFLLAASVLVLSSAGIMKKRRSGML